MRALFMMTMMMIYELKLVLDVDRVERFGLTLRFFDDVSTAS